jgi:hypothetical protein
LERAPAPTRSTGSTGPDRRRDINLAAISNHRTGSYQGEKVKLQFKKRKFIPVAVALVAIIALSGVAYAYWSSTGTGTGSATTGTSVALTAAQTNTITGLVPGGSAEVDITVHNPATFSQSFNAVTIAVTAATGGCDISWFSTTTPTISGPVVLAAGATTAAYTTGSVSMTDLIGTNQNTCKNSTLTLTFTVS